MLDIRNVLARKPGLSPGRGLPYAGEGSSRAQYMPGAEMPMVPGPQGPPPRASPMKPAGPSIGGPSAKLGPGGAMGIPPAGGPNMSAGPP